MTITNKKSEVARLVFEVNKILKQSMRRMFDNVGITLPQGLVIATLISSGEMKISDLSRKIGLSNSTISGIVDRLEKQQLVERTRSEEDRRIVYVKVTPKSDWIHEGIHRRAQENFEDLLKTGTPEEIETVIEGLTILKKILLVGSKDLEAE